MKIESNSLQAYHLLHDGTLALARAEAQGIRVDLEYAAQAKEEMSERILKHEQEFYKTKFYRRWKHSRGDKKPNINSNAQLGTYLYDVRKLKPSKLTVTGKGSTEEDALLDLGISELDTLIQIRKLRKIRDTYLDSFLREQVDGYIHPFFHLHFVRTYRSSSDRPNFQNIPKRDEEAKSIIRQALYPRPGHQLLEMDYGSLEVRVAACYHQDGNMLHYINTGHDMHADMTEQLFVLDKFDKKSKDHGYLRSAVKNGFVFPQFYGDYFGNCARYLACDWGKLPPGNFIYPDGVIVEDDRTLAKHLIGKGIHTFDMFTKHVKRIEEDFWGNRFGEYAAWKERWWRTYQKRGYINMLTGFQCSGLMSRNDAINYPVQGSAFHCLLWSFIELDRIMVKEQWNTRMIGQIHDAIIFDVDPAEKDHVIETVRRVTTRDLPNAWKWITVPLEVEGDLFEVDAHWASESTPV